MSRVEKINLTVDTHSDFLQTQGVDPNKVKSLLSGFTSESAFSWIQRLASGEAHLWQLRAAALLRHLVSPFPNPGKVVHG